MVFKLVAREPIYTQTPEGIAPEPYHEFITNLSRIYHEIYHGSQIEGSLPSAHRGGNPVLGPSNKLRIPVSSKTIPLTKSNIVEGGRKISTEMRSFFRFSRYSQLNNGYNCYQTLSHLEADE